MSRAVGAVPRRGDRGRALARSGGGQQPVNLSLLAGLWLSILAALAGSPTSARVVAAHSGRVAESSVRRNEGVQAHDALRLPRVVTGVASAAGGSPVTHPTASAALGSPGLSADAPRGS